MNFDTIIDRRGTHSTKWDKMEKLYGVSPDEGLAMWVADMDFRPPACVQRAVEKVAAHGVYGYFADPSEYLNAICWWMQTRHSWTIDPKSIFTTAGLVNAVGLCVHSYTDPGDEVVLFTPVYHAFARVIKGAGRVVHECELVQKDGQYHMDFDTYDAAMTGREKAVILCSPHNPGGRVWTREELQAVCDFAKRHDLLLISDEIHQDIVYGDNTHIPVPLVDASIQDRLVMLTAPSKTFNIAGAACGNVIIADTNLRARFAQTLAGISVAENIFGMHMTPAAYSPEGAVWVDDLVTYLDGNRQIFDDGINAIPGLRSMPMQATYLSWVDFAGTGMSREEFTTRVEKEAKIAANHGPSFGTGGDSFLRFNIGTQRVRVEQAVERLQKAFADLQ